jgi:hypothetical protein
VRTTKKNSVLQVGENLEQGAESDGVVSRHVSFLLVFTPAPCWWFDYTTYRGLLHKLESLNLLVICC